MQPHKIFTRGLDIIILSHTEASTPAPTCIITKSSKANETSNAQFLLCTDTRFGIAIYVIQCQFVLPPTTERTGQLANCLHSPDLRTWSNGKITCLCCCRGNKLWRLLTPHVEAGILFHYFLTWKKMTNAFVNFTSVKRLCFFLALCLAQLPTSEG